MLSKQIWTVEYDHASHFKWKPDTTYAHVLEWDWVAEFRLWSLLNLDQLHILQNRRGKIYIPKKVCLAASLTDIKENDSLQIFHHPPTIALFTEWTQIPGLTLKRGVKLHLCHCQSENTSKLQAHRGRANQELMFPPAILRPGLPVILIRHPWLAGATTKSEKETCLYCIYVHMWEAFICCLWFIAFTRGMRLCSL